MTNREKLTIAYKDFLTYCEKDPPTPRPVDPARGPYPIKLTIEQASTAHDLGIEVIRQMPAPAVKKIITRTGAGGYIIKVQPLEGKPFTQYNDRNAGYIVYSLVYRAMLLARKGDFEKAVTFAEFAEAVLRAIKMEFPRLPSEPAEDEEAQEAEELQPEQEEPALPVLTEIKPQNAIIPHTLVANSLTSPDPWGGKWQQLSLPGFALQDGTHATTYLALEWDLEGSGIEPSRKLSLYDKSAHNAAVTLYAAGNEIITERQLAAAMKGAKSDNSGIDAAALAKVRRSLDKQRRTFVKINATKSFEQRGITDFEGEIETYLLPLDKITVQAKGRKSGEKMTAYRFIKEPPVLTHARAMGQIYTVPMLHLQTGNISATDSVVVLRDYLIGRIEAARGGKLNAKILYSTVYTQMELVEPSPYNYSGPQTRERTDKATKEKTTVTLTEEQAYKEDLDRYRHDVKRIRDQVKALMENWKRQGYIKGYSEVKKGKTIEAVTVRF